MMALRIWQGHRSAQQGLPRRQVGSAFRSPGIRNWNSRRQRNFFSAQQFASSSPESGRCALAGRRM